MKQDKSKSDESCSISTSYFSFPFEFMICIVLPQNFAMPLWSISHNFLSVQPITDASIKKATTQAFYEGLANLIKEDNGNYYTKACIICDKLLTCIDNTNIEKSRLLLFRKNWEKMQLLYQPYPR